MMHTASFEASNIAQTYLQSGIDNGPPYRGYDAAARSRPARAQIVRYHHQHYDSTC